MGKTKIYHGFVTLDDPTGERAYRRARYLSKREDIIAASRAWRQANPDMVRAQAKRWRSNNPDKARLHGINRRLKHHYSLNLEQYNFMLGCQGGRCAICNEKPAGDKKLHVDHNHKTGMVRALLCGACNKAIGFMKENPEVLKSAINYLGYYNVL